MSKDSKDRKDSKGVRTIEIDIPFALTYRAAKALFNLRWITSQLEESNVTDTAKRVGYTRKGLVTMRRNCLEAAKMEPRKDGECVFCRETEGTKLYGVLEYADAFQAAEAVGEMLGVCTTFPIYKEIPNGLTKAPVDLHKDKHEEYFCPECLELYRKMNSTYLHVGAPSKEYKKKQAKLS